MATKCTTEWRPEYDRDYSAVRDGMYVCDAAGEKIGEVAEIIVEPEKESGHIVVKKAAGQNRDLYIPVEAVKSLDRDNVFIDCSGDQCTEKGWDKKPSGGVETPAAYLGFGKGSQK
jgi:hypothetical protein